MLALRLAVVIGAVAAAVLVTGPPPPASHPAQPVTVVAEFPHDPDAFTQGFEFHRNVLYEGTGLYGESSLRRVDLSSGDVLKRRNLDDRFFGEGITVVGDRIFQITWKENVAFVYRRKTFRRIRKFGYRGEGWGLAHNRRHLVMSNGSHTIVFRDPDTFRVVRRIRVEDSGDPVANLNELEWVSGDILANVWQTDIIVRIDPRTGNVTARYDVSALTRGEEEQGDPDVANGIAYMKGEDRLFVTGKNWRHVYEVALPD